MLCDDLIYTQDNALLAEIQVGSSVEKLCITCEFFKVLVLANGLTAFTDTAFSIEQICRRRPESIYNKKA